MVQAYGYFLQIIDAVRKGLPFPVYRINEVGGRGSSKTWSVIDLIILVSLIARTKTDAYRWTKGKDRKELFNQIGEVINSYPGLMDKVQVHMTDMTYTFPNGSVIEVSGLRVMGSGEVKLTGKSGSNKFKYQFAWAEERYEIPDVEWGNVLQAIRGTENFMELHTANPWVFSNDYVKYANDNLPFNLEKLKEDKQQFAVVDKEINLADGTNYKYKEIFHYTNYQVNDRLPLIDKVKLEQSALRDPHRANTILYGFPGTPAGGIWKWVLPKMKQKPIEASVYYVGGLDYGERADATAGYVIGFSAGNTHAHIEHEYYWKNNELNAYKDSRLLAEDVVNHYLDFLENKGGQAYMDIMVDGSSIPFITALNTYTEQLGYSHMLKFIQQTNKGRVADRIETMKTMAAFGLITVSPDSVELLRELNEQVYADKARTSIDYVVGDDHATDAIYYGLVVRWVQLLENMDLLEEEKAQEALKELNNGKKN